MDFTSRLITTQPIEYRGPYLQIAVPQLASQDLMRLVGGLGDGAVARLLESGDFTGKRDEVAVVHPAGGVARLGLIGMGELDKIGPASLRRAAAVAGKRARLAGVETFAFAWMGVGDRVSPKTATQVSAEGVAEGVWIVTGFKVEPEPRKPTPRVAEILIPEITVEATTGHIRGSAIAAGHLYCRNLQALPGNICTPALLADKAQQLADQYGFGISVLDYSGLNQEGMNSIAAVGKGSANEPRFISLDYRGADSAPVVLVGKGVTFDTGGISIKPPQNMEDMKYDMSGAAAVLGTFEMLGRLKPPIRVVGLIPAAENMPSATAYKPGDVIKSHFGKHIEVVNTDAEGRLLLADALSYARRYQPACVIDIATLTGAVVIGLGHEAAAVMGNDSALVRELLTAGEAANERLWELPLWDEYREQIKSDIADVKNSGGRPAGSISAGWFLREFVDGFPWAHLDIAGTAYTDREHPGRSKGPTGMGTRLFSEFLLNRAG